MLVPELKQEAQITETLLKSFPDDKFSWRTHEKSMTLGELCNHLVEVFSWIPATMNDVLQLNDYQRKTFDTSAELIAQLHSLTDEACKDLGKRQQRLPN